MKASLKAWILLPFVILTLPLFVQTEIPLDRDTELTEIQKWINQVDSLFEAGDKDSATVLAKIVLEKIEREYGESDSLYVRWLARLGNLYSGMGLYIEAGRYYKKCLEIMEEIHWPNPSNVAYTLTRLGLSYRCVGHYAEAESCYKQALQILEDMPNISYDTLATCLTELGTVYDFQIRYVEAESLYKQALQICVNAKGYENSLFVKITNRLANLYFDQSKYHEAESLYRQGLEVRKKLYGPDRSQLAESLNNLGNIYKIQGRFAEAESSYAQALKIREKKRGSEHPFLVYPLVNLGQLYVSWGNYATADSFYKRALKIVERAYGPDHLHVAWSISAIGDVYRWQGKYMEAEPFYTRALEINKKVFGLDHPTVANSLNQLALLHGSKGEYSKSMANYKELVESRHNFIENVFSYASEAQKMRYINEYPPIEHSLLSLAIIDTCQEPKSCALEMILKGKAVVIDALSAEREITYCLYDDRIIQMEKQLNDARSQIATMSLASIKTSLPKEYRDSLQVLYAVKDSLESQLSRSCSEFRDALTAERFAVSDVANALPQGSVLWEFVRYEPYDFKKVGSDKERTGAPRYLAFTLDHAGNITLTDLGDAGKIDSLVSLARKRIYDARAEVYSPLVAESERRLNDVIAKLYDIIFAPLESYLGNRTDIFISPDGQLNLLPFEILPCPDGKYVIEKFRISYLSSGRDLLRFKKKPEPSDWALVIADPDFDLPGEALAELRDKPFKKSSVLPFGYEPLRGVSGCLNNRFNSLPYSHEEAESVGKNLKNMAKLKVDAYYGGDALEEILKGMTISPRVLHLATHGYFCEDLDLTENKMLENPLLRSGLALAGANRLMDDNQKSELQTEDGVLTAFEASGLNLIGAELVTLSACETGVGEVQNGEGVYGLRRAFQHAGAQTILMSLWKVPDKETRALMNDFYRNWLSGQAKKEALRQSILKVLNSCRTKYDVAHPLLWGGFVMVGDPN